VESSHPVQANGALQNFGNSLLHLFGCFVCESYGGYSPRLNVVKRNQMRNFISDGAGFARSCPRQNQHWAVYGNSRLILKWVEFSLQYVGSYGEHILLCGLNLEIQHLLYCGYDHVIHK